MYIVADTETSKWCNKQLSISEKIHFRFMCCYVIDENSDRIIDEHMFENPIDFLNYCETLYQHSHKSFRIYFHNLDFDIKFLLKLLYQQYNLQITKNHSMLACKCQLSTGKNYYDRNGKKHIKYETHFEFRDSCALFYHLSIEKLGKIVHYPKLEYEGNEGKPSAKEIEYCYRDCFILHKALLLLRDMLINFGLVDLTVPSFNLTLPALSFKLFELKNEAYMIKDVNSRKRNQIFMVNADQSKLFRKNYFGGRVEIFDIQIHDRVIVLDINSLYPYIMTQFDFPLPPYHQYDAKDLPYVDQKLICCYDVEIDETKANIPCFVEKVNGKCLYLNRKKRVLMSEIEYARFKDQITQIYQFWTCEMWIKPFEYFTTIYKQKALWKKEKNPASDIAKLPMNSTYGKFCEKPEKTNIKLAPICILENKEILNQMNENAKGFSIINDETVEFTYDSITKVEKTNTLWGKRITDLARFHLWNQIMLLQQRGIHVIYCDTDSCMIDAIYLDKVQDLISEQLGMFKIEHIVNNFLAIAPKEYFFTENDEEEGFGFNFQTLCQKSKGFALENGSLIDFTFGHVKTVRPAKFSECFVRKLSVDCSLMIEKQRHTFYDKRLIGEDLLSAPIQCITENVMIQNSVLIKQQLKVYYDKLSYLFPDMDESVFTYTVPEKKKKKKIFCEHKLSKNAMIQRLLQRFYSEGIDLYESTIDVDRIVKDDLNEEENYMLIREEIRNYG